MREGKKSEHNKRESKERKARGNICGHAHSEQLLCFSFPSLLTLSCSCLASQVLPARWNSHPALTAEEEPSSELKQHCGCCAKRSAKDERCPDLATRHLAHIQYHPSFNEQWKKIHKIDKIDKKFLEHNNSQGQSACLLLLRKWTRKKNFSTPLFYTK